MLIFDEMNLPTKDVIVGFNTGHHGGCAIMADGKLVAVAEERLNRKKNSEGYLYALNYCLNALSLTIQDVDLFASSSYHTRLDNNFRGMLEQFGVSDSKFTTIDHHMSHAASSYYFSGFDEAIILTIDGLGNMTDTESYYIANKQGIRKVGGNDTERSIYKGIGRAYEVFTNICGWSAQEAGKTMGLSPFGKDKYPKVELYDINDNNEIASRIEGKYKQAGLKFIADNKLDFGVPFSGYDNKDAAYFVQNRTEKVIIDLVERLYKKHKIENFCLSGGVFLNSIINHKILTETSVKNIFVPPFCDDTGQAIGNIMASLQQKYGSSTHLPLKHAYLGKEYGDEDYIDVLEKRQVRYILPYEAKSCEIKFKRSKNVCKDTAKLLAEGKIIGWFQGASEIGPRALGHRSILCSPFPESNKDIINKRIKHREAFRPFAPSVLETRVSEYFDMVGDSPYMLKISKVKKEKKESIAATIHVDDTARVQTVNESNDRFFDLITEFDQITRVPVLLNTSFNDNNEPIVETPKDAFVMFAKNDLDVLVMGDYIVWKK